MSNSEPTLHTNWMAFIWKVMGKVGWRTDWHQNHVPILQATVPRSCRIGNRTQFLQN